MSKPPSSSSWPAWLLFTFLLVGPPTAVVEFLPTVTKNPWIAGGLLLAYEGLIGLGVIVNAVVKKMWERRGDAWVDASTGRLEKMARLLFAGAERRYKKFFHYEYADLDMKGISTRGTYTLDLEQVFVEVRIDPTPAHKASADPIRLPPGLTSGTHDIWDYLTLLDQHLVILGAPGSGKTTLLKHLGLRLLQKPHRSKARAKLLPWTIPLFLPLREHTSLIQAQYGVVEAANKQIEKWKQAIPPEWIEQQLQKGKCLVLLDGLDEIADSTQRQQMVDWAQRQMLAYPRNRFVVTSRPLGYQSNPLNHVTVLEVQPFTFEQVTQFLHSWYLANEIKRAVRDDPGVRMRANAGAEDLVKRLHSSSALFAMAANPLLLTMIATVHLYYGKLPGARITLYKAICEVFLSRRADIANSPQELRAEQRQLILQVLAYTFMQQGEVEMAYEDVCSILSAPLQFVSQTLTPQDFLKHLEPITSGLLLERERGVYGFAHKTFQEYLAVMHIQEHHLEHELLSHIENSWWHETILLFCAQADATTILEACIAQSLPSLEALTLAIDCAEEARTVKPKVKERFYAFLEQESNHAEPERRKVIAEMLLKRRLRQMRPLQDIVFVDASLIACVEYQLFLDEQRVHGRDAMPDTWSEGAFPQGHGRDPLLGVRLKDAQAFCYWLNARDREGLSYRLPRLEERQQIQSAVKTKLCVDTSYWEEDGSVVWSQSSPSRSFQKKVLETLVGSFTSSRASALALALVQRRSRALDFARALDLTHDRAAVYNLTSNLDLALALVSNLTPANEHIFDFAVDLVPTLSNDHISAYEITGNLAHALTSTLDYDSVLALAKDLTCLLNRANTFAYVLSHADDFAGNSDFNLAFEIIRVLNRVRMRAPFSSFAQDIDIALDIAGVSDLDLARALALIGDLATAVEPAFTLTLDQAKDIVRDCAEVGKTELAVKHARDLALNLARSFADAKEARSSNLHSLSSFELAEAFKIYLILFLFVYRLEGMDPAYEGILLVKEHKTETVLTSDEIGL